MNVQQLYQEYVRKGLTPKDAAKQAQAETGLSVVTGKPINRQLTGKFGKKGQIVGFGQYGS